jgi:hypothetical protein
MTSLTRRILASCVAVVALLPATPGSAQTETTLIHGIVSSGATWDTAASRLSGALAINTHQPDLPWSAPYDDQALTLDTIGGLGGTSVAIGHSNGGVVARRWVARGHRLDTLVTVGTPHFGAPLVANLGLYGGWFYQGLNAIFRSGDAFSWLVYNRQDDPSYSCCDWQWLWYQIAESLNFGGYFTQYGVFGALGALGVTTGAPVLGQMDPRSAYLQGINSGGAIGAEAGSVPVRIGIVSTTSPLGGPLRLVASDSTADWIGGTFHGIAWTFYYLYFDMSSQLDPWDYDGWDAADRLYDAAQFLDGWDVAWCAAVSSVGMWYCDGNDDAVPYTSQQYPNALLLYTPWQGGPAHTSETSSGGIIDMIQSALVNYGHVPPRGGGPPGGGSGTTNLYGETYLYPGQSAASPNGRFVLTYQSDGNFVLYDNGGAVWAINCWPQCNDLGPAGHAVMQGDGNLVVYDGYGNPVWHTGTYGNPGAYLGIGDDGSLRVYGQGGNVLWSR